MRDRIPVVRLAQEGRDAADDFRPDAIERHRQGPFTPAATALVLLERRRLLFQQCSPIGRQEAFQIPKSPCQHSGSLFAHRTDAQREQEALERRVARSVDGSQQVGRGLLAHARQGLQGGGIQPIQVGRLMHQVAIHQLLDQHISQPVDVHGAPVREVPERALALRTAEKAAHAAPVGLAGQALHGRAADRALAGHAELAGVGRALIQHHTDHLGNHVTGAAHDDAITDQKLLAADLVLVVQRGVGDVHAPHEHRLQPGHGREHPGAPHLHEDVLQRGDCLFGRILVGQREAGGAGHETCLRLQMTVIQLIDHAIDGVGQRGTHAAGMTVVIQQRRNALHTLSPRRRQETQRAQPLQHAMLRGRHLVGITDLADAIGIERERPAGGDTGIQLAQASGGRIARVGKELVAPCFLCTVQCQEVFLQHQHLAPHFQHLGRRTGQLLGHAAHRAQIGRDVLAGDAIAPGGALHQPAVLVAQRGGQAIQLGGGTEGKIVRHPQQRLQSAVERQHISLAEGVGQRAHGHPVRDGAKTGRGGRTHPLGG